MKLIALDYWCMEAPKCTKTLSVSLWWRGMKRNVAQFIFKCMVYQQVKAEHQKSGGSGTTWLWILLLAYLRHVRSTMLFGWLWMD